MRNLLHLLWVYIEHFIEFIIIVINILTLSFQKFVADLKDDPYVSTFRFIFCHILNLYFFQNVELQKEINKAEEQIIMIGLDQVPFIFLCYL